MRAPFLLIAFTLVAACSDDKSALQAATTPTPPPTAQRPAPAQADVAAAEVAEPTKPASDPCDLSGYDMSKMTVDRHEELVKICEKSKQK